MPQILHVGHRSTLSSLGAWLLKMLGREPDTAWPPRQRLG